MLFTSPLFLFAFLPVLLTVYYLAPRSIQVKNAVALAGSVLFFSWGEPLFVFLLLAGVFIDYRASRILEPGAGYGNSVRKWVLIGAITLNVLSLLASKYLDFIVIEVLTPLSPWLHWEVAPPGFPLLLGISFITFHRISYLVDSYKGRAVPPRGFLDCALYIFLFPQLIAGPIIRYHDIGAQIHDRRHTPELFLTGFVRFSVGLLKKVIIADPLGLLADRVFAMPAGELTPLYAWGGIVAYTLQIYFDFSGYSDMALGLGRTMGFSFPENFNRPYISTSVTEFWRRWHISLSSWMRLYLYIPLGGNKASAARMYLNLWIVFLISGIWHGASWNFIAWGAYYGFFLSVERLLANSRLADIKVHWLARQALTIFIVMVGWVLFRSPTLTVAKDYLAVMFLLAPAEVPYPQPWGLVFWNRDIATMALGACLACVTLPKWARQILPSLQDAWSSNPSPQGFVGISAQFVVSIVALTVAAAGILSSDYSPFLYFRF